MPTRYFDTSALDSLQRQGGRSSTLFSELLSATAAGRLRVVIGLQLLDETVAAYPTKPKIALERLDLIEELCDLPRTILPAPDLLRQDVISMMSGSSLGIPYVPVPPDLAALRRAVRDPGCDIRGLLAPNRLLAQNSAEILRACRADVQQQLEERGWPKISFPAVLAEGDWVLQSLVDRFFGPGALPGAVLRGLLRSRPVRMYQGASLSLLYSRSVENRTPLDSDFMDLQHTVSASVVDGLVTEDTDLASYLRRVPIDDFSILSLEDLQNHRELSGASRVEHDLHA
jgi:hypothetical protein